MGSILSRTIFISLFLFLSVHTAFGADEDLERLRQIEDSMVIYGDSLIFGSTMEVRAEHAYRIVGLIKETVTIPGAYNYPFDSVQSFSVLRSPDNAFRLWSIKVIMGKGTYHYIGAVETAPKKKKPSMLIPLIDGSIAMDKPEELVCESDNWYGAFYYRIVPKKVKRKTYYMLFGWDGNNFFSTKKVVDVLQIDRKGNVTLGAPIFYQQTDSGLFVKNRFIIEFKKGCGAILNYEPELDMIMYDHLITLNPLTEGMFWTYVPDGSYESFEWDKKKRIWIYNDKVFNQTFETPPNLGPSPRNPRPDVLPPRE